MLTAILNFITDAPKTLLMSLMGASVGTSIQAIDQVNTAFQHAAWTVAIVAGIMTMINLFFPLRSFYDNRKKNKNEKAD